MPFAQALPAGELAFRPRVDAPTAPLFARSIWPVAKPGYEASLSPMPGTPVFGLANADGLNAAWTLWIAQDMDVFRMLRRSPAY